MRVPFIAAWGKPNDANPLQNKLPIARDVIQTQQAAVHDIFPTLLNVASVQTPVGHVVDGIRLDSLLTGKRDPSRSDAFLMHYPHAPHRTDYWTSYREGEWKVIYHYFPTEVSNGSHYQLFQLSKDPFEQQELSRSEPAQLKQMMTKLVGALKKCDAVYPVDESGKAVLPIVPQ